MTSLDRFLEPIHAAGKPWSAKYKAYRMDGNEENKNMRKKVDLGTCHSCDYFMVKAGFIVLIEETDLLRTVKRIKNEYEYLNNRDKGEVVNRRIREENQLKVYGSMLILCRLSQKCRDIKQLLKDKKYKFWLVADNIRSGEDKRYFDSQRDSLKGDLTQVLGRKLLDDVAVLSPEDLRKRLSKQ